MLSGFQASDIGQYGIGDMSWWSGGAGSVQFSPFDIGGGESPFWDVPFDDVWPAVIAAVGRYRAPSASILAFPSGASLPSTGVRPAAGEESVLLQSAPEAEAVVPRVPTGARSVISSYDVDWKNNIPETGVGVYTEEAPVAIDWGSLAGTVLSSYVGARYASSAPAMGIVAAQPSQTGLINQYTAPAVAPGVTPMQDGSCSTCPTGSPRYSKICNATGEITPLRRRRRRRLFTSGDLSDIAALKALVGGGAALNAAVVKAMK